MELSVPAAVSLLHDRETLNLRRHQLWITDLPSENDASNRWMPLDLELTAYLWSCCGQGRVVFYLNVKSLCEKG